jgi:hypothetical protein
MSHTVARQQKNKQVEPEFENEDTALDPGTEQKETHTPSWFSRDLSATAGEALADQYRATRPVSNLIVETLGPEAYAAYRKQLEDKFSQAQTPYDASQQPFVTQHRPTLPLSDIHGRRRLHEQEQRVHRVHNLPKQKSHVPWGKIAGFSMIAILIGGVGGFGFSKGDQLQGLFQSSVSHARLAFAGLLGSTSKASGVNNVTTIQKKTVATASLEVNDVRGTLNSMIPLMLNAQAADGAHPVVLKVMGLPQDAYLTAGTETTKGNWLLKPSDIAGVKLVVPQSSATQFNMEIAAVEEASGVLAAPVKAMNVQLDGVFAPAVPLTQTAEGKTELASTPVAATIAPANAQPETASIQANAIPAANPEASDLISKADGLLNGGDIASARQYYLQADKLGDMNGAYGVGRTYDPQVFAALNVQGLKPDAAKAADWYKRAVDGGVAAAKNALSGLQTAQP